MGRPGAEGDAVDLGLVARLVLVDLILLAGDLIAETAGAAVVDDQRRGPGGDLLAAEGEVAVGFVDDVVVGDPEDQAGPVGHQALDQRRHDGRVREDERPPARHQRPQGESVPRLRIRDERGDRLQPGVIERVLDERRDLEVLHAESDVAGVPQADRHLHHGATTLRSTENPRVTSLSVLSEFS